MYFEERLLQPYDQTLVSSASYLPYGPLNTLTLGNGLTETHAFIQRYFPSSITLGSLLSWTYTTDKVGNISTIADTLNAANNRTYGYQDDQYFLTQGNGPWGTRAWTYDRIGNRLTETHSGTTDTYTYQLVPPPGSGHSPILASIALGAGGTKTYQYDPAGNLKQITQGTTSTAFTNDDASHLAALTTTSPAKEVAFTYDGRDYLTLADTAALPFLDRFETGDVCAWSAALGLPVLPTCPTLPEVHPTYSSAGLLHALQRATAPQRSYVFHFAGRPVAQMDLTGTTESWKLLTVDHLGTPIAATSTSGTIVWQGGFEPFGADWSGAGGAGVFLRFPGQWVEGVWGSGGLGLSYNLYRWYDFLVGRYQSTDPVMFLRSLTHFLYVSDSPLTLQDPDGRLSKPANGKWCGSSLENPSITIPKPPCEKCNKTAVNNAATHVQENRQKFCTEKRGNTRDELQRARGGIDTDRGARTWYVPTEDPCVDYCICSHEQDHVLRVQQDPYRSLSNSDLECLASLTQLQCLRAFGSR